MGRHAELSLLQNVFMKTLQTLYNKERNPKAKLRLLAAIKRKEGKNIESIAQSLDKPVMTVYNWLRGINKFGLKSLYDKPRSGRPTYLNSKQLNRLKKDLIKGPKKCGYTFHQMWTRKLLEDMLRNKYKISFSDRHVRRMLTSVGFSFTKPRKKHYKSADKRSQERFKKTLEKESDTGRGKDTQYFVWMKAR